MDFTGLTNVSLGVALIVLVARVIRSTPPGAAAPEPVARPAVAPSAPVISAPRFDLPLRYCGVCEVRMAGACAHCAGPACLACDYCFGCRSHICDACDFEPTPPFWRPGDKAPHPHNTLAD